MLRMPRIKATVKYSVEGLGQCQSQDEIRDKLEMLLKQSENLPVLMDNPMAVQCVDGYGKYGQLTKIDLIKLIRTAIRENVPDHLVHLKEFVERHVEF